MIRQISEQQYAFLRLSRMREKSETRERPKGIRTGLWDLTRRLVLCIYLLRHRLGFLGFPACASQQRDMVWSRLVIEDMYEHVFWTRQTPRERRGIYTLRACFTYPVVVSGDCSLGFLWRTCPFLNL
nr:hypothetical protein CFP56_01260 [Quercus suber]